MRRLGIGLLAVAVVLVGGRAVIPAPAGAAPRGVGLDAARPQVRPPNRVSLYGDSLAYQARDAFAARMAAGAPDDGVDVATYPTTALCDFRGRIVTDLVQRRPEVIVLEFSGNSFTPCMREGSGSLLEIGSSAWRDRYLDDLRSVMSAARATGTTVVWATAPPVHHPPEPEDYPRRLATAVRAMATTDHRLHVADTGASVAGPRRSFVRSLPCGPGEPSCRKGRVVVRADDGLHFDCHGAPEPLLGCDGYSAGARRFGDAMADAAIALGDRP